MKKFSLVLGMMLLMGVAGLTACGKKDICIYDGCENEAYKDGYCEGHYKQLQEGKELGKKAADAIGGLFK